MESTDLEIRSREILGHLYDVAGVGMCVTDIDRCFVAVNREYCKTYGYDPSELCGGPRKLDNALRSRWNGKRRDFHHGTTSQMEQGHQV